MKLFNKNSKKINPFKLLLFIYVTTLLFGVLMYFIINEFTCFVKHFNNI